MSNDTITEESGWVVDESEGGRVSLTEFDGYIKDAYFGTDANYGKGQSLLLTLETEVVAVYHDDEDELWAPVYDENNKEGVSAEDYIGETQLLKLGLGAGWVTEDKGKTAVHERNKAGFHISSLYGQIIALLTGRLDNYHGGENASVAFYDGDTEVDLAELGKVLQGRGDPKSAEIWKDLTIRFTGVKFDYGQDKEGKDIKTRMRPMPASLVAEGKVGEAAKKKAPAKKGAATSAKDKAAAAKAKAAEAKASDQEEAGDGPTFESVAEQFGFEVDDDIRAAVEAAIAESSTEDELLEALVENEDVMANDSLVAAIASSADEGGLISLA